MRSDAAFPRLWKGSHRSCRQPYSLNIVPLWQVLAWQHKDVRRKRYSTKVSGIIPCRWYRSLWEYHPESQTKRILPTSHTVEMKDIVWGDRGYSALCHGLWADYLVWNSVFFHIECESSLPDGKITIRLFEYDALFRIRDNF